MPSGKQSGAKFVFILIALSLSITFISAFSLASEAGNPGAIVLHPHGHDIPELASAVDFLRADLGIKLIEGGKGTFEAVEEEAKAEAGKEEESKEGKEAKKEGGGEEGPVFILKSDDINFKEKGVGKNIHTDSPLGHAEDMLYSVSITASSNKHVKGRYIVTMVEEHALTLMPAHVVGDKPHHIKLEGPVEVTFTAKEEATMTSNVVGQGYFASINWTDINNIIFAFLTILILVLLSFAGSRNLKKIPSGFQALVEMVVGGLDGFTKNFLGDENRKYLPLLGTLFLYILCMALMGLIPGAKSPIALNLNIPVSMAICVFLFVQYHGIRQNGVGGWVKHLLGEPIWLAPLQFPLHVLGEFIKPLSLSLRLYANISAEDILVAALVFMMVGLPWFIPVPLQVLFFPLALMFSGIQALVFMSLSAIYISQMSAHH